MREFHIHEDYTVQSTMNEGGRIIMRYVLLSMLAIHHKMCFSWRAITNSLTAFNFDFEIQIVPKEQGSKRATKPFLLSWLTPQSHHWK